MKTFLGFIWGATLTTLWWLAEILPATKGFEPYNWALIPALIGSILTFCFFAVWLEDNWKNLK